MTCSGQTRNILVTDVNNLFDEEIVRGLAAGGNALILCGHNNIRQEYLLNHFPGHIKAVTNYDTLIQRMELMAVIERQGSLDAVICLINSGHAGPGLHPAAEQISSPGVHAPVRLLREICPYLKKTGGCEVMFVQTDSYMTDGSQMACRPGRCGHDEIIHSRPFIDLSEELGKRRIGVKAIVFEHSKLHHQPDSYRFKPASSESQPISGMMELLSCATFPALASRSEDARPGSAL